MSISAPRDRATSMSLVHDLDNPWAYFCAILRNKAATEAV